MILAAIVCSLITSSKLGTFFTLDEWVPSSVSSDRQFGSAPAVSNGTFRIDDDAAAGINSVFEGWCERCYYPSCGTNNSFSASDWGAAGPGKGFRFDPPAARTNSRPGFAYSPDKNRAVNSVRLLEYGNLKALADAILADGAVRWSEDLTETYRPTWSRTRQSFGVAPDVWWSSSAFDKISDFAGDTGDIDPPEFGWTSPGSAVLKASNKWKQVYRRFQDTCSDIEQLIDWSSRLYNHLPIPYRMFSAVDYGEFDPQDAYLNKLYDYVYDGHMNSNTMYVLRSAFPGKAVTDREHMYYAVIRDAAVFDPLVSRALANYLMGDYPDWATNFPLVVTFYVGSSNKLERDGDSVVVDIETSTIVGIRDESHHSGLSLQMVSIGSLPVDEMDSEDIDKARFSVSSGRFTLDTVYGYVVEVTLDSADSAALSFFGYNPPSSSSFVPLAFPCTAYDIAVPYSITNHLCKLDSITNVTRRLDADPVSGLSQVVSCLDRSYSMARFPPFNTVTNFRHTTTLTGNKELQYSEVSVSSLYPGVRITLTDPGAADKKFECGDLSSVTSTVASSYYNPRPDTMFARTSPVEEGLSSTSVLLSHLNAGAGDVPMTYITDFLSACTNDLVTLSSAWYFDAQADGGLVMAASLEYYIDGRRIPGVDDVVYELLTADQLGEVTATAAFRRRYERENSLSPSDADYAAYDVVWPGRYIDGRVGKASLWALMSSADTRVMTGVDSYELDERFIDYAAGPWSRRQPGFSSCVSETQYRSTLDTYTDAGTCVSVLKDATDAVYDKCMEEMGDNAPDFDDPRKFIDPMCRRAIDYMNHMRLPGTLAFDVSAECRMYLAGQDLNGGTNMIVHANIITALKADGGWELRATDSSTGIELRVDPYSSNTAVGMNLKPSATPSESPSYYGDDPYSGDRFRGAVSNGRVSGVHRVDWSWKALKRTGD